MIEAKTAALFRIAFDTSSRLFRRGLLATVFGSRGNMRRRLMAFCRTCTSHSLGGRFAWGDSNIAVTKDKPPQVSPGRMTCLIETSVSRRNMMRWAMAILGSGLYEMHQAPKCVEAAFNPFAAPPDLVMRLKQRTSEEMTKRLFEDDLYYPDFFAGTWKTSSTLLSVACPAGYKLFGRTGSFEEAKKGIGESVQYESRFVVSNGHVTADRAFNVTAIARATLGPYSVLQCETVGNNANRVAISLRPDGTDGSVYQVDLRTIARHEQLDKIPMNVESAFRIRGDSGWKDVRTTAEIELGDEEKDGLYTNEVVRQDVRLDTDDMRVQPLIKHVETNAIFVWNKDRDDSFSAWQKTSTYLPKTNLMYVDARGRPIDVRWYKVEYTRS